MKSVNIYFNEVSPSGKAPGFGLGIPGSNPGTSAFNKLVSTKCCFLHLNVKTIRI